MCLVLDSRANRNVPAPREAGVPRPAELEDVLEELERTGIVSNSLTRKEETIFI